MADETPSSEMMDEQLEAEVSGARAHVRQRLPAYIATLIGGTVAMFVNAPLTSPDDLVGNTASVAFVSVVAALVAGMVWARISGDIQRRVRVYNVISTVLIIVVVAIAAAVEYAGDVSNTIRYVIPLGAVVAVLSSIFTPIIERWKTSPALIWVAIVFTIALLVAGYVLTVNEFGFTEAPSLALPPPPK